jgi:predicted ATPase/class 3 adenylate cyclase
MERTTSFGYWLRRRRKALDLTQAELARQVGCAVGTIKKLEGDDRRPSRQMAERMADLLQMAPEERAAFLKAARAELATDQLDVATAPLETPAPTPLAALPTGTVTFLFTDIEDSTQLWSQHPDGMPAALARHDILLREAIERHGGAVFKTVGDGFYAAFVTATDALAAALAAQRALQTERWGQVMGPHAAQSTITVRMALHTGTAEIRDGDYYGHTLNRVARIVAAGHGGQVLLSAATWELLRDHLPTDTTLRDLGAHWLKSLPRPEQIYQLVAAELPSDFPPLVTLDQPTTNLPAQTTTLIGREHEVATVCELLRHADVRLVTLTGPGGTGKTRLAQAVAAALLVEASPQPPAQAQKIALSDLAPDADRFPNGVWFINLAPISDPSLVASTIAQALDVRESGGQPILGHLKDYLRGKRMLLLLDNFEQIVDAAPLVSELLAASPGLKVLVTSRMPLRLSSERAFAVPPLALPPAPLSSRSRAQEWGLEGEGDLIQYEAVRLFIERALAVRADFAITNANAPAVAEICHRLDGLPLAIELAAARITLFSPEALLKRLSSRLRLLIEGARDQPVRQQTIRNTLDWSYNLLDAGEKTLFARLGVFVGEWTIEATDAVATLNVALSDGFDTLDGITALVDKSLLRRIEGLNGEPRFVMLETLREYALERLEQRGETEIIRQAHLDYYLQLAEQAKPVLQQTEQLVWVERLNAEYDNLRAALLWGATGATADKAGRVAAALLHYWRLKGNIGEGRQMLDAVLAVSSRLSLPMRAQAFLTAGFLANWHIDSQRAMTMSNESLALYQELGDRQGILHSLFLLGDSLKDQRQTGQAHIILEEALLLGRELNDREVLGAVLIELGRLMANTSETARPTALLAEGLRLARERGDRLLISAAFRGQAELAMHLGDFNRAQVLLEESLALRRELGGTLEIGVVLNSLGELARLQNDYERAAMFYEEYARLSRGSGSKNFDYVINMGYVALQRRDYEQAREFFAKYIHFRQGQGIRAEMAIAAAGLAGVASGMGQPERAARLLGASEALNSADGTVLQLADQAEYDHILADVRTQLDTATFEAMWEAGRVLTLEQALAEALSEGDPTAR